MVNPLPSAHRLNKITGQPVQLGLLMAQTPYLLLSFTQPRSPMQRSEPWASQFDLVPDTMCGSLCLLADTGTSGIHRTCQKRLSQHWPFSQQEFVNFVYTLYFNTFLYIKCTTYKPPEGKHTSQREYQNLLFVSGRYSIYSCQMLWKAALTFKP